MTRQWTVKVDGNNVKTLHDGESVEIGRKPLRPLSDDGFARLDIMDPRSSTRRPCWWKIPWRGPKRCARSYYLSRLSSTA